MDDLLKLLKKNAIESPSNLAKMLKTTEEDIKKRIADYEKRGIIKGYQAIVNEDQLDMRQVRAVIEIRITPERGRGFDHIAARIGGFPEVDSLFLMSGAYDLLAVVKGKTLQDVAAFVSSKLATIEGVVSTATHFILKVYKDQGVLMEETDEHERLKVSP